MKKLLLLLTFVILGLSLKAQNSKKVFTNKLRGQAEFACDKGYLYFFVPVQIDTVDCNPVTESVKKNLVCDGRSVFKKEVTIIKVLDDSISSAQYFAAYKSPGLEIPIYSLKESNAYYSEDLLGLIAWEDYRVKELRYSEDSKEMKISYSLSPNLSHLCVGNIAIFIFLCLLIGGFFSINKYDPSDLSCSYSLVLVVWYILWIVVTFFLETTLPKNMWLMFGGLIANLLFVSLPGLFEEEESDSERVKRIISFFENNKYAIWRLRWFLGVIFTTFVFYGSTLDWIIVFKAMLLSVGIVLIRMVIMEELIEKIYASVKKYVIQKQRA